MKALTIMRHEQRVLARTRVAGYIILVAIAVCLYSIYRGAAERAASTAALKTFVTESQGKADKWRTRLVAVETGSVAADEDRWAGLAMDFRPVAIAPPGPLADFSIGVSDVQPISTTVSQWRTIDNLFGKHQFQSPVAIAAGPFDFAFVVVFILPLLMLVVGYDVLSEETESGRLGLLLSNPVSVRSLVLAKLRVRLGLVFGVFAVAAVIGLLFGAKAVSDVRLIRFIMWMTAAVAYLGLWAAFLGWVVSLNKPSNTTILSLVTVWTLTTLVGPAIVAATAESIYPMPSRLAFLSKVRSATGRAYKSRLELMKGMVLDHPTLATDGYSLPEYIRTAFIVGRTVDRGVEPILEEMDATHQARSTFIRRIQYASPAIVTMEAFNTAAGTSLDRQKRFEREARRYKRTIAGRIETHALTGTRLTVQELDNMPLFAFAERPLSILLRQLVIPVGFLVALALLFASLARSNLRRLQTRIRES